MTIDVLKQARDALKYADDMLADHLPDNVDTDPEKVRAFNEAIVNVCTEIARLESEPKPNTVYQMCYLHCQARWPNLIFAPRRLIGANVVCPNCEAEAKASETLKEK